MDIDLEKFKRTKNYANSLKGAFGIKNKEVIKVSNNDIDIDSHDIFGAITLLSKDDITIRYGERGLEPSSGISPIDLLKKKPYNTSQFFWSSSCSKTCAIFN